MLRAAAAAAADAAANARRYGTQAGNGAQVRQASLPPLFATMLPPDAFTPPAATPLLRRMPLRHDA